MGAFLYPVFNFFANNKWAQWLLLAVTGLFVLKLWGESQKSLGRKLEKARNQELAQKQALKVAETRQVIEETRSDDVREAQQAAADSPMYSGPDELREQRPRAYSELFKDRR
jgi:hypothetical protein